jgi:hypothetical protein
MQLNPNSNEEQKPDVGLELVIEGVKILIIAIVILFFADFISSQYQKTDNLFVPENKLSSVFNIFSLMVMGLAIMGVTIVVFGAYFWITGYSLTSLSITEITKKLRKSEKIDTHSDLLADLEYINDPEIEKKLKKDWLPGLIWLAISDPVTAVRTATQRFRTR